MKAQDDDLALPLADTKRIVRFMTIGEDLYR